MYSLSSEYENNIRFLQFLAWDYLLSDEDLYNFSIYSLSCECETNVSFFTILGLGRSNSLRSITCVNHGSATYLTSSHDLYFESNNKGLICLSK